MGVSCEEGATAFLLINAGGDSADFQFQVDARGGSTRIEQAFLAGAQAGARVLRNPRRVRDFVKRTFGASSTTVSCGQGSVFLPEVLLAFFRHDSYARRTILAEESHVEIAEI